ncbi:MAG: hypothetical protein Q9211_000090 [Gyalolechia sp. 1 TL-2023]
MIDWKHSACRVFGHGKTLIFRFTLDSKQQPQSLTTRIVNCYHDRTVESASATFPDRSSMRTAIWSAIAAVWPKCNEQPAINDPDVIIDVYDTGSTAPPSRTTWSICHDTIFNDFLDLLLPPSQLLVKQPTDTVDFTSLTRLGQLGGRGCTTLVHTVSNPKSQFVFKGIDFRTFLNLCESGHIKEEVKTYYRSMELVSSMPPHPNIMAPANALVTICKTGDDRPVVCGTLHALLPNGNLGSHIQENNESGERIPLSRKALWCYQMAAAVAHTHFVAHTYHMDIKPGNFLLDADHHLVLIDWEQSDAPVSTAAPEIDGTWDVEEIPAEGLTPTLRGWNVWNVFRVWNDQCPKALELAEVFSLGRSMWMLLRQPDMNAFEDITRTADVVEDWASSDDIPAHWKQVVQDCLKHNPNERISLRELLKFWDSARRAQLDQYGLLT